MKISVLLNQFFFLRMVDCFVVLKRAQYFITCNGKYYGDVNFDEPLIRNKLSPKEDLNILEQITDNKKGE